jgi:hypothetical protein
MALAERYRQQANWARAQAEKAETPALRDQWLSLAREYDRLATDLPDDQPGN